MVCANAALAAPNPHKPALLICFGEFWLELARHDMSQISENIATDIAVIEQIEAKLLGAIPTSH